MMKQYRVKGIDAEDKPMYLRRSGYWDSVANADLFTEYEAQQRVKEINVRNTYLHPSDRIVAAIERAM